MLRSHLAHRRLLVLAGILLTNIISFFGSSIARGSTLRLAAPIGDRMVLQQGQSTAVWGTATSGATITVTIASQKKSARASDDGDWLVNLHPMNASADPRSMVISSSDGETIQLNDILIGEVWMCSGQSNMYWSLGRFLELERTKTAIAESDFPDIRFFNTELQTATVPQSDCSGKWQQMTPQTAVQLSATAYYFGRHLYEELGIPIGLVCTAWGGTPVESFISTEKLETIHQARPLLGEWRETAAQYNRIVELKTYQTRLQEWIKQRAKRGTDAAKQTQSPQRPKLKPDPRSLKNYPSAIFNQMIAPWTNCSFAGVAWYQGGNNRRRAVQYQHLLRGLVENWRDQWGTELPFFIVQSQNYGQPVEIAGTPSNWAEIQHAQAKVAEQLPNCSLCVINDLGERDNIHPKNKHDVGARLARLVLKEVYRKPIKSHASPLYRKHAVTDGKFKIRFTNIGDGLATRDGTEPDGFQIAGNDRLWYWANAKITAADTVTVWSERVSEPVAVRYAWAGNPERANVVNSTGLPASLFRTDDWPLSTSGVLTLADETEPFQSAATQDGYAPLFNGKNFAGWRNPYDWGQARVDDGEIHLSARRKFFLTTDRTFADFELLAELKLPPGKANSGIMFRCHVEPNRVYGYQAECDGSDRRWSGGLFDEGRRKWIWPSTDGRSLPKFLEYKEESQAHFAKPQISNALKRDDWNQYRIRCQGKHIVIAVNGVEVTNLTDDADDSGYIAIQHHGEQGQTYRFRNILIKEL